ncbi:MAG: thiamine-phosphate kinase [Candidatus Latescibacterota bacterium]
MKKTKHTKRPNEQELISAITRIVANRTQRAENVVVGIGDDAAVVRCKKDQHLILTTDIQVENIHFRRDWFTGGELGWRLAAVNLSDIAAMGGRPLYALLSLACPNDVEAAYIKAVEKGVAMHLRKYGAEIIGGNISASGKHLVCDLTLIGDSPSKNVWQRRCRPGRDAILLVGAIGSARAGLAHIEKPGSKHSYRPLVRAYKKPRPLLEVADLLRGDTAVHGAIDVSDGFSTDLIRICDNAGAGCEVDEAALTIERSLIRFCQERAEDPVRWALQGGEDYALILSVAAGRAQALAAHVRERLGLAASVAGRFTARKGRYELLDAAGKRKKFTATGWDHLARPVPLKEHP